MTHEVIPFRWAIDEIDRMHPDTHPRYRWRLAKAETLLYLTGYPDSVDELRTRMATEGFHEVLADHNDAMRAEQEAEDERLRRGWPVLLWELGRNRGGETRENGCICRLDTQSWHVSRKGE